MINIYNGRSYALGDYQHAFKKFFKDELKDGKPFDKNHKIAVSHRYHENADKNFQYRQYAGEETKLYIKSPRGIDIS